MLDRWNILHVFYGRLDLRFDKTLNVAEKLISLVTADRSPANEILQIVQNFVTNIMDFFDAVAQAFGSQVSDRFSAAPNQLDKRVEGEIFFFAPFLLKDNLCKRYPRQILLGVIVDNADILAITDQVGDILKGDVATIECVVQFSISIPFYDADVFFFFHCV